MDTVNTHVDDIRSPSVLSKESEIDIELPPGPDPTSEAQELDDDDTLAEEESFMTLTQEEQLAWEETIKQLQEELKKRGEDYSQWSDKITRRRMYAYSRMKKLETNTQIRKEFYGNIEDFIQTFHGDVLMSDESKVHEGETSFTKSDTQIQTFTIKEDSSGSNLNENSVLQTEQDKSVALTPVIKEVPPREDNSNG